MAISVAIAGGSIASENCCGVNRKLPNSFSLMAFPDRKIRNAGPLTNGSSHNTSVTFFLLLSMLYSTHAHQEHAAWRITRDCVDGGLGVSGGQFRAASRHASTDSDPGESALLFG